MRPSCASFKTLEMIDNKPVAEFRKEVEALRCPVRPARDETQGPRITDPPNCSQAVAFVKGVGIGFSTDIARTEEKNGLGSQAGLVA